MFKEWPDVRSIVPSHLSKEIRNTKYEISFVVFEIGIKADFHNISSDLDKLSHRIFFCQLSISILL